MTTLILQPRIVRQRDAPGYVGVDRNKFDAEWRPYLTEVPLGQRALGYDRLELDRLADAYIAARGRPGRNMEGAICELGQTESSLPEMAGGSSTSSTRARGFSSASARSARHRPKHGSESECKELTRSSTGLVDEVLIACGQKLRPST